MSLPIVGFEHLHLHTTHGSLLDGFGTCQEYANRWQYHGNFLCVSDHGMMAAVPHQIRACDSINEKQNKKTLHPIYAVELYVNKMHFEPTPNEKSRDDFIKRLTPEEYKEFKVKGNHLLAIAINEQGYKNLVRLSSWGFQNGFYSRPRVNYEILKQNKEGIIFTSCCYASEIGKTFDTKGEEAAEEVVVRYAEMFAGQFYLEIMLLDFRKQKPYDVFILKMKEKYKLPLIVTNDCHYCLPEDSHYQRLMLMIQTNRTLPEIKQMIENNDEAVNDLFELQDSNLWMKTEEELNSMWSEKYSDVIPQELFEEGKKTTVEVCRMAKGVELDRKLKFPKLPDEELKLKEAILEGVKFRNIPKTKSYSSRIEEEYELICRKGFASYFLIIQKMTNEARRICPQLLGWGNGREAVGCGRGSAAGSLVLYLLGVTDIDPIKEDLLFSRFLSDARGGKQLKLRFSN
jgi:DNA polymerase-3 subunit alpha